MAATRRFEKMGYMIGNVTGHTPEIAVVGKHRSKSVIFPVVEYNFANGASIVVRDNLYNFSISVISPVMVPASLVDPICSNLEESISSVYCEGFPKEKVYGAYAQDQRKFTFQTWDQESFAYFMIGFARLQKDFMPPKPQQTPTLG